MNILLSSTAAMTALGDNYLQDCTLQDCTVGPDGPEGSLGLLFEQYFLPIGGSRHLHMILLDS